MKKVDVYDKISVSHADFEALEPQDAAVEELEEVIPAESVFEEDFSCAVSDFKSAVNVNKKLLKTSINMLSTQNVSSLFLNKDFVIIYSSKSLHKLFDGYYKIENKPFFYIFKDVFSEDERCSFFNHLRSIEYGFSWAGILPHKNRYKTILYTKVNIFPLFEKNIVAGYWAVFEDITNTYTRQYSNMMNGFLNASKLKDNDTGFHNERLNYYSKILTEALFDEEVYPQIDATFIKDISALAAVHDIGKIGTPDYILQKKGPLSQSEWKIMKDHTISGALILSSYPTVMAKEIALSHHEHWDGTGYPYNLSGEMIPLSARIVAVADVYDALRMKRSYKEGFSHEQTLNHILEGRGKHFDPLIINVFEKMSSDFNDIWESYKDESLSGHAESTNPSQNSGVCCS